MTRLKRDALTVHWCEELGEQVRVGSFATRRRPERSLVSVAL
jgi:hypothetical protein